MRLKRGKLPAMTIKPEPDRLQTLLAQMAILLKEIKQEIVSMQSGNLYKDCPACESGRMASLFTVWVCSDCGYHLDEDNNS